jgi:hypothetical protein
LRASEQRLHRLQGAHPALQRSGLLASDIRRREQDVHATLLCHVVERKVERLGCRGDAHGLGLGD